MSEICDGIDNDCNSQVDDGLATVTVYADADGDGFGDINASPDTQCGAYSGWSLENTDCDDGDAFTFPGAAELEVPDSCLCMTDADEDGYGDDGASGSIGQDQIVMMVTQQPIRLRLS